MKVIYVVDSISKINNKINLLQNNFGDNIIYIVKADLVDLFKTYGYNAHAVYYNNLSNVIHSLLVRATLEDVVVCYSSLEFDNKLLNKFREKIGDKTKVVNVMPKYNFFEQMCNSAYNVYVKSLFKVKDSMATPKLQFLPSIFVAQLVESHFGNRLFEVLPEHCKTIYIEEKELNKSMKVKTKPLKYNIISLIIALVLTIALLACVAYLKINYLIVLMFIILYILDLTLIIIFQCKTKFDQRFLK